MKQSDINVRADAELEMWNWALCVDVLALLGGEFSRSGQGAIDALTAQYVLSSNLKAALDILI